ncbi:hypothetical protein HRG_002104 [Hirsutella rhossiliensis]|uniref:Uncharacterized protein n=1 Tax=Hirsutella rhossiliensis TaxID=111463 RepID=A0A9P8SMC4_9HYPO|nr:uncharacterized protein HRG_02104 [Hirsutella rhossiliensis]XP_044724224.1 uncharacterized protein HRG_02120 [Hirsutella rhossiliensis]KAH0966695.1 hypothetical protein HRG_02104 [Hirsutella rhossiliensis]KAH0966711.1 hypothetical protein HRG_02120 [Hirsutella rhossiliensis]
MEHDAGLRQPDFSTAAGALRLAAEHLELCDNLPAVDGGARLAQRMDAVLEQLTMLNRKVDGIDRRMDVLDRKVTVSNRNAVVRARNATVVRGDMDLVPLHSVLTGEVIEGFPDNVNQLERLHVRDVDQLLRHMGESTAGSAAEKKRNLKFATGLVTREL